MALSCAKRLNHSETTTLINYLFYDSYLDGSEDLVELPVQLHLGNGWKFIYKLLAFNHKDQHTWASVRP